ncbi:SAM-dependent methyltransferase [Amycolatopsis sp. WAC 04169]|uniref:class I SAM-dependent methyltransferase n=1 Tax=Amycolatopsis sp. WAC 04169 TaxID=2203197 RepID=UPI000F7B51BA|nr:SAM-dependent methyltransferase [Amycolatopsis sp. WAC 04169]RSN29141.1 SAM-dependent methyltransferase [Amycolatopsis sp. WAC 04169]
MSPASTAETATLLRAAGSLLPQREVRGPDTLAAYMLPWRLSVRTLVKVPGLRALIVNAVRRRKPGALWFELVRTRYMDDILLQEIRQGADQVVILGAGFDSRAHRMRADLQDVVVYEVDRPALSQRKQARVRSLPAADVRYVTIDFNDGNLHRVLSDRGFDPTRRTIVIWSGVVPYLKQRGVEATLRWLAAQSPGSSIVFDYCWQEVLDDPGQIPEADEAMRDVASRGEPWLSGIPRGTAASFVHAFGLSVVEDLDLADGQARYLTLPNGARQGPIWTFGGFVHACVPSS